MSLYLDIYGAERLLTMVLSTVQYVEMIVTVKLYRRIQRKLPTKHLLERFKQTEST